MPVMMTYKLDWTGYDSGRLYDSERSMAEIRCFDSVHIPYTKCLGYSCYTYLFQPVPSRPDLRTAFAIFHVLHLVGLSDQLARCVKLDETRAFTSPSFNVVLHAVKLYAYPTVSVTRTELAKRTHITVSASLHNWAMQRRAAMTSRQQTVDKTLQ